MFAGFDPQMLSPGEPEPARRHALPLGQRQCGGCVLASD